MSERYTDEIIWDNYLTEMYDEDLDGSGTEEGLVLGHIETKTGRYTYEASGKLCIGFDRVEIDNDTIEETGFDED